MVQDEDTCGNGTTTSGWKGRVICYAGPGREFSVVIIGFSSVTIG
jgi:hypothetical protein